MLQAAITAAERTIRGYYGARCEGATRDQDHATHMHICIHIRTHRHRNLGDEDGRRCFDGCLCAARHTPKRERESESARVPARRVRESESERDRETDRERESRRELCPVLLLGAYVHTMSHYNTDARILHDACTLHMHPGHRQSVYVWCHYTLARTCACIYTSHASLFPSLTHPAQRAVDAEARPSIHMTMTWRMKLPLSASSQ